MFEVILHTWAERSYARLDEAAAHRVNAAIERLRTRPVGRKEVRKLRGELEGKYRVRVGDLRIIYRA